MANRALTIVNSFGNQAGPIPLAQLDTNYDDIETFANEMLNYSNYVVDSSVTPNIITLTTAAGLAFSYSAGMALQIKVANTSTTATVNINVNALGNQLLKTSANAALAVGQIAAGQIISVMYDGAAFRMVSPGSATAGGSFTGPVSISGDMGAGSALTLQNTNASDGRTSINFHNDKGSAKQYEVGIDPGGSNTKAWAVRDLTRGVVPFSISTNGEVIVAAPASGTAGNFFASSPGNPALTINNSANTGSGAATFTAVANKPGGAAGNPTTWLSIIVDGTQRYWPVW